MSGRKKKTNRLVPEVPAQSGNGERDFLEDYDAAGFHHPSVAVDVAAMTAAGGSLHVLLVRRSEHPHKGRWALAGGFAGMRESLDAAASRVLEAKAGLRGIFLEQLYSFGAPDRDPRTRIISVAYYALVVADRLRRACRGREDVVLARLAVSGRGEEVRRVRTLNDAGHELLLAFDHGEILGMAVKRLRGKLDYAPIGFQLLPERFTLRQLQEVHEAVLGRRLNKDSFRRSVIASRLVAPTGETEKDVPYRPAELYRYVKSKDSQ